MIKVIATLGLMATSAYGAEGDWEAKGWKDVQTPVEQCIKDLAEAFKPVCRQLGDGKSFDLVPNPCDEEHSPARVICSVDVNVGINFPSSSNAVPLSIPQGTDEPAFKPPLPPLDVEPKPRTIAPDEL